MTNKTSGFRLYLQVRIGKALRTDEAFLTTYLDGREVRIRASLGPSISKAEWLVFEARGFPTESEAHGLSVSGSERTWSLRRFVPALASIRDWTRS